jgi:hypothetical protein
MLLLAIDRHHRLIASSHCVEEGMENGEALLKKVLREADPIVLAPAIQPAETKRASRRKR